MHRFTTQLHRFTTQLHRFTTQLHRLATQLHRLATQLHRLATQLHRLATQLHRLAIKFLLKQKPLPTSCSMPNTSASLRDATRSLLPRRGTLSTSAPCPMPHAPYLLDYSSTFAG
ncbi:MULTISPECIES: hypothetical protein [Nostoc]|uniref:Uncharacterized protein n=1 Tax=Nostoc paludosum FACHB-159 TaxID=2692908 RepID=A0ABR8KD08_9NOSO|nr:MULTISPECIES: hypothetical protein [Nostoc]MBD2679809.1 hypothetical protein [Nostoc sp. FACHB-857]MBD2736058.1 hypothetical protein [Nostoc paludosum FACHB-159]